MLKDEITHISALLDQGLDTFQPDFVIDELGTLISISSGVAMVSGLPGVQSQELLQFSNGDSGIAFNLDEHAIGVIMLDTSHDLKAGTEVRRTGRVLDIPVGYHLLGRVIAPDGQALDERGDILNHERWPIERDAAAIIDRAPVTAPLETGIKVIDALIPVGRGQRELILGDRQTGKTAIALSTLINQRDKNMVCVYCAIGQRSASVAKVVETLEQQQALSRTVVVVASGDEAPGMQYIAPYAATSIAEYFMHQCEDVLIIYDDLTRHARAYRELSLLLRRPPGREAFPGDIFYLHSRLLERSTQLNDAKGGGSLTALPILETEAGNISAYIPTNLISITDGQIYLSPDLFSKGMLPAIDVSRSVSRVGGKTQLPAFRDVAGHLRFSYAQFEELETFARFGTRLDDDTRHTIEHGQRVREVLKQNEHEVRSSIEQIMLLMALDHGCFDQIPLSKIRQAEEVIMQLMANGVDNACTGINLQQAINEAEQEQALELMDRALKKSGLVHSSEAQ